jgi:hypothetical protein
VFYFGEDLLEKCGFSESPENSKVKPEQIGISTMFISEAGKESCRTWWIGPRSVCP